MSVDKSTVVRIADLARIKVPEEELDAEGMALRWRKDEVTDGGKADDVLANAPEARDGYFVVPKVIE